MPVTNTFTTKFAQGQEVWVILQEMYTRHKVTCHCGVKMQHAIISDNLPWYVCERPQKIVSFVLNVTDDSVDTVYESEEMQSIREHSTFATQEEAEAEVERRNTK